MDKNLFYVFLLVFIIIFYYYVKSENFGNPGGSQYSTGPINIFTGRKSGYGVWDEWPYDYPYNYHYYPMVIRYF